LQLAAVGAHLSVLCQHCGSEPIEPFAGSAMLS
jgi:hypothetical protein